MNKSARSILTIINVYQKEHKHGSSVQQTCLAHMKHLMPIFKVNSKEQI